MEAIGRLSGAVAHDFGLNAFVRLGTVRRNQIRRISGMRLLSVTDWLGGGLMVDVAPHVAVRGDVRYFHAFSGLSVGPLALSNVKIDFGRAAGGLVFSF